MKRFCSLLLLSLLCMAGLSGTALGQSITGSLVGVVADASGAVVVGATVTVRDVATSQTVVVKTGKDGQYQVPNLDPSVYEIKIVAPGFSTTTVPSVRLLVNATQRNDIHLTVGSADNTVNVSASPDAITTDSASIGTVIDGAQVARYPLNGRTVDRALLFVAGNTSDSASAPNIGGATRWGGTYYTVDGVPFNDLGNGAAAYSYDSGLSTLPSTETIQEIKVESSLAKAEFEGGSAVSIITKSGSNRFHGEIYEFNRNRAYAARDFYAKNGVTAKPELNRNEYGGTLGGPIWKDKTFFFGSAEYFTYRAGKPRNFIVPTDAQRNGDFSALSKPLYNPVTGTAFVGNKLTSIDPRAAAIVAYMPHANLPNAAIGANNLTQYYPTRYDIQRYTAKFDHTLNSVHTLTLGGTYSRPSQYFSPNGTPAQYGNYDNAGYQTQSAFLRDNMVFSSHIVNTAHYAYLNHRSIRRGQNANFDPSTLFPGLYGPFATGGLPTVSFNGLYTGVGDTGGAGYSSEATQQALDNFTYVHGKHTFKVGAAVNFNAIAIKAGSSNANALGSFGFNGRYTSSAQSPTACLTPGAPDCSSGDPFADFLLGYANTTARSTQQIANYEKYQQYGFFGQDDWNLTSRVTLNFGLRWEMQTSPTEAHGDYTNFDFASGKFVIRTVNGVLPKDANPTLLAAFPGTYTTSEAIGWGNSVVTTDKKDFGPRFGFAIRPTASDKLVIRGGYGIYYNFVPPYIGLRQISQLNFPFVLNQTYSATTAIAPQLTLANPFPGTGTIAANPTLYAVNRDLKNARVQQWNLTVEQALPTNIGLRLSYVGNRATQAPWYVYNKNLPTPMRALTSVQSGRPYQPWGDILTLVSKGYSNTNQLQFEATKRTGHGLYLQTSYTLNSSLDDVPIVGTPQDPYNPTGDVGTTDGTRRHNFFLTGTYELQTHFHGFGERAVNGWSISSLTQVRSGSPFTPTFSIPGTVAGQSTVGWYATRANVTGADPYAGGHSRTLWFNPAAFSVPAPFTFGNARRNSLTGPNETGVDLSLEKKTKLWESANLLLRFDAFNVLNHPNFGNPSGNISSSAVGTFSSTGSVAARQVQIGGKIVF